MRAARSLEPKVPRLLSSPNSPDDLWPEPISTLKSSFPGGLCGKALGPPLPSCQPCSWLERLGLNLARRVVRHPPLLSFQSPSRFQGAWLSRDCPCHLRSRPTQSRVSARQLLPFLFFLERSWSCSPHRGRNPNLG